MNTPRPVVFILRSEHLLDMLRRAHAGEDPDEIHLTEYANATHTHGYMVRGGE